MRTLGSLKRFSLPVRPQKLYLAGLALVALTLTAAACQRSDAPDQPQGYASSDAASSEAVGALQHVVNVRAANVRRGSSPVPVTSAGRIASRTEHTLSFKTGGIIESITVDEGSRVRRGQLLARLDLGELDAQRAQASAALDKAQRDLNRAEELFADEAVTREQLDNARTALDVATSGLEIADFNLRYSEIRAPASGWILRRTAEPGELVGSGQQVLHLGSADSGWVLRLGLPDRDVVRLERGDLATISIDALPGETFDGTVLQIAENAGSNSGTFEVEIALDNSDSRLKSGFMARASITPSIEVDATTIPPTALVRADGLEGLVYAVDLESEKGWRPVPVTVARLEADSVAIASGLEDIERVIVDGIEQLTSDSHIEVIEG